MVRIVRGLYPSRLAARRNAHTIMLLIIGSIGACMRTVALSLSLAMFNDVQRAHCFCSFEQFSTSAKRARYNQIKDDAQNI